MADINLFDGPIPGENYTSDTKNYPWHRPPEFTDFDKAIDMIGKKLLKEGAADSIVTMIELGIDVTTMAQMFLMSGVSQGKWTVDFALLLAGPVAHMICILCEMDGVDYDLGIGEKKKPSAVFFKEIEKSKRGGNESQIIDQVKEQSDNLAELKGGFMDMALAKTNQAEATAPVEEPQGVM